MATDIGRGAGRTHGTMTKARAADVTSVDAQSSQ